MCLMLARLMEQHGLTVKQAARRFRMTPRRLRDMESGVVWPDWEE
jgi:hypothetical protein